MGMASLPSAIGRATISTALVGLLDHLLSLMVLVHFLKSCESPMVQWPQLQIKLGIFVAFNFLFLLAKFLLKQRHLSLTFWVLLISVGNLELISITFTFEIFSLVTYSSTLARKIPWMEEPHRLQSMGSQRVGHNWVISLSLFTFSKNGQRSQ